MEECWHLTEQMRCTRRLSPLFRPLLPLLLELRPVRVDAGSLFPDPGRLIHFYRRVVLKDPLLPEELLPAHWAGQTARQLCINIYQRVSPGALAFVSEKVSSVGGSSRCRVRSIISALAVAGRIKEVACRYIRLMD
ncbi:hypothetical protein MJ575_13540 [Klebsiella pneumoniae]|nr:hypothetical protein MJ575_13540 [Klebsiella pneumoniae]